MVIKIIILAIKLFYTRTVNVLHCKRAEMAIGELTIAIGKTVYNVTCSFNNKSKVSISDKLMRLMENELEKEKNSCYNYSNTNSQIVPQRNAAAAGGFCEAKLLKSLDCEPERSIV